MTELGETFRALSEHKKQKRRSSLKSSTELLRENGIEFDSKNGGIHLIIKRDYSLVDFWPSTGRYIVRRSKRKGRGVLNLLMDLSNE